MTAALLSSLDKLPERVLKAKERSVTATADEWKLSTLTHMAFSQVIQLKDSGENGQRVSLVPRSASSLDS